MFSTEAAVDLKVLKWVHKLDCCQGCKKHLVHQSVWALGASGALNDDVVLL